MALKKAAMSDVELALQSPNDADAIKTAEERLAKWQADVPVLAPNEENINLFCALRKIAGDARLHPKTMLEWKNKMSSKIKHSEKLYKNHWAIEKIDVLANVLPAIRKYVVPPEKLVSRGCVVDTEVYYIVRQAITEPELDQLGIHDVAQVEVSVSLDTEVPLDGFTANNNVRITFVDPSPAKAFVPAGESHVQPEEALPQAAFSRTLQRNSSGEDAASDLRDSTKNAFEQGKIYSFDENDPEYAFFWAENWKEGMFTDLTSSGEVPGVF